VVAGVEAGDDGVCGLVGEGVFVEGDVGAAGVAEV
jgi:hypothetical protein